MAPATFTQIGVLLIAAGIAIWMAIVAFGRSHVPGSRSFGWLNVAVGIWSLAGAFHAFEQTIDFKIFWATVQYIGIVAVPPLWLLFAADYSRAPWAAVRRRRRLLWLMPATTLVMVLTNEWHHFYWTSIAIVDGRAAYSYGPLFWLAVLYNYVLVALGTVTLIRGVRLFNRAYRSQTVALVTASFAPWIGNLLFLVRAFPPGFDPTPLMFTVSGSLFMWGLYAHQLFDLVPTARTAVFERIADAVFVLDRSYRIVDANRAAAAVAGRTRYSQVADDEVIGRHPAEVIPWWGSLEKPPAPSDAEPVLVTEGDRLLEVQASPFVDERGAGGTLLWVRDVTARRKAEHERRILEGKLREQQRIESLTVMAAGIAHDFNNLLTAILGNADFLIATTPKDSEQHKSAAAIATGAQQAADLVSHMVAYSGQGRTSVMPVSVEDAVGDVLRAFSRTLGDRAMIMHESQPDLPPVPGDLVQVRQVVYALLTNAVDAVAQPHGSVEVLTGREHLDAKALADATYSAALHPGDFVFVEVKDDGQGIPADVLPRVFEPFFSTRDMGRGLGLAAVHGIVRGHKGAIRVWSTPGQGTRIRVWWPLS